MSRQNEKKVNTMHRLSLSVAETSLGTGPFSMDILLYSSPTSVRIAAIMGQMKT